MRVKGTSKLVCDYCQTSYCTSRHGWNLPDVPEGPRSSSNGTSRMEEGGKGSRKEVLG